MDYKCKIGQELELLSNHYIETSQEKKIKVSKGDRAMVIKKVNDNTGEIVYITGKASGLSDKINIKIDNNLEVDKIVEKILNEM